MTSCKPSPYLSWPEYGGKQGCSGDTDTPWRLVAEATRRPVERFLLCESAQKRCFGSGLQVWETLLLDQW